MLKLLSAFRCLFPLVVMMNGVLTCLISVPSAFSYRHLPVNTLKMHSDWVRTVAFSPNGRTLASGSSDGVGLQGEIKLWNILTLTLQRTLQQRKGVQAVVFSVSKKLLASGNGANDGEDNICGEVRIWLQDGKAKQVLNGNRGVVYSVAFSPNGKLLAAGTEDEAVQLWDMETGKLQRVSKVKSYVSSVVFSPDGKSIVGASGDGMITFWDTHSGAIKRVLQANHDGVRSVAFSPDGRVLASAGEDKMIRLWHIR